ncbi:flagellar protein FlaG [Pseudoalteromonas mariniglutinosa]|uniref:flagellar protein FlaG n=1 Tax=Pseudoalteromonas mariniglutinosa TaxID=206042 RepID=UPI00384B499E
MAELTSLKGANDISAATPLNNSNVKANNSKEKHGSELAFKEPIVAEKAKPTDASQEKQNLIDDVKKNLEKLNEYIPVTATNLVFEFDELGDPPIIKVLDKESQEVIREIPSKEFREVAKALDEFADKLTNKGLLFNRTA